MRKSPGRVAYRTYASHGTRAYESASPPDLKLARRDAYQPSAVVVACRGEQAFGFLLGEVTVEPLLASQIVQLCVDVRGGGSAHKKEAELHEEREETREIMAGQSNGPK